jgi:hypothetical protein
LDAIHLEDLYLTAYGFQVLSLLDLGSRTNLDGLRKIEIIMNRLGMKVTVKSVEGPIDNPQPIMSNAMYSLLMKRAHRKPKKVKSKKYQIR